MTRKEKPRHEDGVRV